MARSCAGQAAERRAVGVGVRTRLVSSRGSHVESVFTMKELIFHQQVTYQVYESLVMF